LISDCRKKDGRKTRIDIYNPIQVPQIQQKKIRMEHLEIREVRKNNFPVLLVFLPVFCVAAKGEDIKYAPFAAS